MPLGIGQPFPSLHMRALFAKTILFLLPGLALARTGGSLASLYDPPAGYYAAAEALVGAGLKSALHQKIRGHRVLAYGSSGTVPALRVLDAMPEDPSLVQLLYWGTGRSAANYGGGTGQWNHEHYWTQSFGVSSGPGNSDLFNLRPCDVQANNERSSFIYAEILGGTVPVYAPLCRKGSGQWMPLNSEKGDLARAMFYMAVRYEGGEVTPDLELSDTPNSSAYRFGKLSDLLRWHREDPVDEAERRRNHLVYTSYQYNRNPFVDDPDYAEMVFRGVPVVHLEVVRGSAVEGSTETEAAAVRIFRRGPVTGDMVVPLQYGGLFGSSELAAPPAQATIPAGFSSTTILLAASAKAGVQGERPFTVALVPGTTYAAVDGPASLSVLDAPDSLFAGWAASFGLTGPEAAPTADPDGDSFANLFEYAGGSDPAESASVCGHASFLSQDGAWLGITAIVRTNDPALAVLGEVVTDVSRYSEKTAVTYVQGTSEGVDQQGVPGGFQRQTFRVGLIIGEPAKFLRLNTVLAQ